MSDMDKLVINNVDNNINIINKFRRFAECGDIIFWKDTDWSIQEIFRSLYSVECSEKNKLLETDSQDFTIEKQQIMFYTVKEI